MTVGCCIQHQVMFCPRCHRRYEDNHRFCPHDGEKLSDGPDIRRIKSQPCEQVGAVVADRYQVRGLIGRGAMARVFLAQDLEKGGPVALKILEVRVRHDPRVRARFILEAKAAASVNHPSIVEVLDIGLHDKMPYIIMEYLFGESLGAYVTREKKMDPALGIPIIEQIASGLGAAHRSGVIHRDIKPGNIFLVGEKGSPWAAKIVDFGFAKLYEHSGLTQAGVTVGTIEYMASEQAVGDAPDARTDIYGLGALMYRMFSGRLPFKDSDQTTMLAHQLITPAPAPDLGGDIINKSLEAIIMKCLYKKPENRYPNMDALIDDLRRIRSPKQLLAHHAIEEPDIYVPRTGFGKNTARFFYKHLGKEPLPELSS